MVRIGVFNGIKTQRGLSLLNFTALNELEDTRVPLNEFNLVGRYREEKERLHENRIYLVNITEDPSKPIKKYEILDRAKFIEYVNGEYLITYKKYRGTNLIDFYENRPEEAQAFLDHCLLRGKKGSKRLKFSTFTKFILNKLFLKYGYEDVVAYDTKDELKKWTTTITNRVKSFNKKLRDQDTNWSKDEEELLMSNLNKPSKERLTQKELGKVLNRTVPSIATKIWKIKHEYKSKLKNMKLTADEISEKLKDFRGEKNLTQAQLSEKSGVSLSIVNQLECKKYKRTTSSKVVELLNFIEENGTNVETKNFIGDVVNKIGNNEEKKPSSVEAKPMKNNSELSEEIKLLGNVISGELRTLNNNFRIYMEASGVDKGKLSKSEDKILTRKERLLEDIRQVFQDI